MKVLQRYLMAEKYILLMWITIFLLWISFIALLYPGVQEATGYEEFKSTLPPSVEAAVGAVDLHTVEGWFNLQFFGWLPLVLGIYLAGATGRLLAAPAQKKELELILAQPLSRQRYFGERVLGLLINTLLIYGAILLGVSLAQELMGDRGAGHLYLYVLLNGFMLNAILGLFFLGMSIIFLDKNRTLFASLALMVFLFLLDVSLRGMERLAVIRIWNPFHHYAPAYILEEGKLPLASLEYFLISSVIIFFLCLFLWQRRDL